MKERSIILKDIREFGSVMEDCVLTSDIKKGNATKKKRDMSLKALEYIESNPCEDYCRQQLAIVEAKYFPLYWANPYLDHKGNPEMKKKFYKYERENELPKLRDQIKFLKYILE